MVKRLLISLLLIVIFVAAVTFGATMLFKSDYSTLQSIQAEEAAEAPSPSQLPTLTPETVSEQSGGSVNPEGSFGDFTAPADVAQPMTADSSLTQAKGIVSAMTLQEKVCQMFFVTPEELTGYSKVTQSGDVTRTSYEEYPVGGVVYFGTNLVTTNQTTEMIANIQQFARERSGFGLFIGVDEEGGSVARLADNLGTAAFDDMAAYGEEGDSAKAYEIGSAIAADMQALGFNVDFAPCADVLTNEDNTVVQRRSFGSDPELVSQFVSQEVSAFVTSGILCAPKHFPGHGSTGGDTHDGYASSDLNRMDLESCDLKPFQAAIDAGAPMIMVGHMTFPNIDREHPASLSSVLITDVLRNQMGYDGIIITDAMNMGAITQNYTSGEAAVAAIQAGCDMILCTPNLENAVDAVLQAVEDGEISRVSIDESVVRIIAAKLQYGVG